MARRKGNVVVIVDDVRRGHCGVHGHNAVARAVMAVSRVSVSVKAAVEQRTAIVR